MSELAQSFCAAGNTVDGDLRLSPFVVLEQKRSSPNMQQRRHSDAATTVATKKDERKKCE